MVELNSDFVAGALFVVGLVGLNEFRKLFQAPNLYSIDSVTRKQIPPLGDNSKITIWGFDLVGKHPSWSLGVSDSSPYVSRVEAYLRLCCLPYVKAESKGLRENPRRKVPFANVFGVMVDDSSKIIELIKPHAQSNPDKYLTKQQQNTAILIRRLLQGSLYWVELNQKFNTSLGQRLFSEEMSEKFPPVLSTLITKVVFRNMSSSLYGQGIARIPYSDVAILGREDVLVLSDILGKNDFMLGTTHPTSIDADVYVWLALLFYDPAQCACPWVGIVKDDAPNLVAFIGRMRAILYPELPPHNSTQ